MSTDAADVEGLLRRALAPVEPPESLSRRLESTLEELTEMAVDELEAWELRAMRDPRNWMRPVIATAVGATAGTALVVLRVRQQQRRRAKPSRDPLELARRTTRAAVDEARSLLRR